MADRWAVIVAVETYLHKAFGPVAYAETDLAAIAAALAAVGIPAERQIALFGPYATTAVLRAKLKRLKRQVNKGDDLLVVWAGRGRAANGHGYLVGWDTLPDDLAETAVSVADLVGALHGTKAKEIVVLLAVAELDHAELEVLFAESSTAVALTACDTEETLHTAEKQGLWSQLVVEALQGRSGKGRQPRLTAAGLQAFLEDELPRRLRKHTAGGTQTPRLYGGQNGANLVADRTPVLKDAGADGVLDAGRLRRVVFRSETTSKVRELAGFRKTFQLPTTSGPSARKFIARLATEDIRADLDRLFTLSREHFGYKRKDIDTRTEEDGTGTLRTPDFEYAIRLDLDAEDPARIIWRREVGQFAEAGFVRGAGFAAVFGSAFDRLVFEFAKMVDVSAFIDRVEESPPAGVTVTAGSDGNSCAIALAGFAGGVTVKRHQLEVRGRATNSAGLLDQFLQFLRTFGGLGDAKQLATGP